MSHPVNNGGISSLPPEMIAHIFEFLSCEERLRASRTCKEWHQLAFSGKFGKEMNIKINSFNLGVFCNSQDNKKFRNATISDNMDETQSAQVDFAKSASLESINISSLSSDFIQTILSCTNVLTKLNLTLSKPADQCFNADKDVLKINHPTLKSISVLISVGTRIEINCPNLIDLKMDLKNEKTVHVVTKLQHQLQSLDLTCYTKQQIEILANTDLSNLRKLCLHFSMNENFVLPIGRMVKLVELQLYSYSSEAIIVGEQFSILTSLSKLILCNIVIHTRGFAKALLKMVELQDLELIESSFTPSNQFCRITSDTVRNLHFVCGPTDSVMLPNFTKLKRLSITKFSHKEIDDVFMLVCNKYPELEKLRFGFKDPKILKFRSSTSFAHIGKLKQLKHLQLVGLDPKGIDWTACNDLKIEKLQLKHCVVRGTVAQQLVQSIGRGLYQFYLDKCYLCPPRQDVFDDVTGNDGDSVEGLRKSLPWCRVSYKKCYELDEGENVYDLIAEKFGTFCRIPVNIPTIYK